MTPQEALAQLQFCVRHFSDSWHQATGEVDGEVIRNNEEALTVIESALAVNLPKVDERNITIKTEVQVSPNGIHVCETGAAVMTIRGYPETIERIRKALTGDV